MDQKDQGSGSSSNVPQPKRKRGRPPKYQTVVQDVDNMTRNETTDHPMVGNLETTDNSAVGSVVHGVVEGSFGAGYLVHLQLLGEPNSMRGVVFKPGQVNPVTPENDVAPHLKMIKRTNLPIPPPVNRQTGVPVPGFVPKPVVSRGTQTEVHGSGSSLVLNRQTGVSGFVPMPVSRNRQTEVHGFGSSSVLNRPTGVHGSGSSSVLSRQTGSPGFVPMPVPRNRQTEVHGSGSSSVLNRLTGVHGSGSSSVLSRQTGSPGFVPMPVLRNRQTEVHGSGSSSVLNRQTGSSRFVPMPVPRNRQTEVHGSGFSSSVLSRLTGIPDVDPTQLVPIRMAGGVPGLLPMQLLPMYEEHLVLPTDIMSDLETDKLLSSLVQDDDALHEVDASTKVKESTADGGVTRDSKPASPPTIEDTDKEELSTEQQSDTLHEPDVDTSTKVKESSADCDGEATRDYSRPASNSISLVQTTEDTAKALRTEQQAVPSVHQQDQLVHEEPDSSNIENPATGGPESMQSEDSEQISKFVDNIAEKQPSPKSDLLDTETETDSSATERYD